MNNILVLSLGNQKDFIASSQLLASLRAEYPKAQIDVLTSEKNRPISEIMNNVTQFHYFNLDLINNIIENPLYSDAFALNHYTEVLYPLCNQSWDKIINYSNDNTSAYLMSAIKANEYNGAYINQTGAVQTNDNWSLYQNYVLSKQNIHPLDQTTIRNHIAKCPMINNEDDFFKHQEDYTTIANQNFMKIRSMKGSPTTLIVGINLEVGFDGFQLTPDTLEDVIEAIEESEDFKPVLLISGKNYQREIINELNKKFNNSLISINLDMVALPSVLGNIDFLVSPANAQMMIADKLDVRTLELREDSDKRMFCSTFDGNYIFNVNSNDSLADDILFAINEEFGTALPVSSMMSTNKIFKTVSDKFSHFFTQVRGDINIQTEMNYHIERAFFLELLGYERNTEILKNIRNEISKEEIENYISAVKADMTSTVKVLLATLRSLKNAKNSQSALHQFISYLDTLIIVGNGEGLISSIVRFFEGEVDNIYCESSEDNLKAIEEKLFSLKGYLQMTTQYMELLTTTENMATQSQNAIEEETPQG